MAKIVKVIDKWAKAINASKRKLAKQALKPAAEIVKRSMVDNVPVRSGALQQSIGVKIKVRESQGFAVIGPRTKYTKKMKGQVIKPSRYAHLTHKQWLERSMSQASGPVAARIKAELKAGLYI